MHDFTRSFAATLLALALAPAAGSLPYEGTLELTIGGLEPIVLSGSGDGTSTPNVVGIGPGANFTTTTSVPIFGAFPIVALDVLGPAGLTAARFSDGAGPADRFGGDAPLLGSIRLGLFGPPPFAFLTVPLSPAGVEDATAMISSPAGVAITVSGGGWTTGTAVVIGTTPIPGDRLLAQATGTDARTPGGGGTIVLVTPVLVRTNIAGSVNLPATARLTLNFVPEPGTGVLLGTGIIVLTACGRRAQSRIRD